MPDTKALLASYRARLAADQLTDDELREAITLLRGERQTTLIKGKNTKPPIDTDALLKDLFS